MKPEELPTAPSPNVNPNYIFEIIHEAERRDESIQKVFVDSLFQKAGEWANDMAGRQAALHPMTEKDMIAYVNGFGMPLACLIAARNSLEHGKSAALIALKNYHLGMFSKFIENNLDELITMLKVDPSGVLLVQDVADQDSGIPYVDKGTKLFSAVYQAHWKFFEMIINSSSDGNRVDLW